MKIETAVHNDVVIKKQPHQKGDIVKLKKVSARDDSLIVVVTENENDTSFGGTVIHAGPASYYSFGGSCASFCADLFEKFTGKITINAEIG